MIYTCSSKELCKKIIDIFLNMNILYSNDVNPLNLQRAVLYVHVYAKSSEYNKNY